jgi:Na+/H+ antiporter NhaD/arsenite permease-like protein
MAFAISAVSRPAHYFWASGGLSSFLDNAPTYLTYFQLALARLHIPDAAVNGILTGTLPDPSGGQLAAFVRAISAGAVFFGANTYIGNAPNFMVKSIAESHRVKMPSFFGYMAWSVGILIPLFALVTLVFFR